MTHIQTHCAQITAQYKILKLLHYIFPFVCHHQCILTVSGGGSEYLANATYPYPYSIERNLHFTEANTLPKRHFTIP